MGLANLVSSLYGVPGAKMTLIAQSGDPQSGPAGDKYTGLDRFGRLVDKRWIKTGTSDPIIDLVRAQYTYDRAGNRLTHTNPVAMAEGVNLDQSYTYDGLYQVASHQTGIGTGIPATEERFTYDPTGNWNRYKALAVETVTEDTPRTNNRANQITQIDGTPELIAHNATGNTTRIPKPADPTKSFDLKWDAWNRLVKVSDSETGDVVAVYTYDGLTRRISTDDGTGTYTRRYYYNNQWRCVEEFNGGDFEDRKLLKRYFWGAQNRWELIARQRDTNGNETLDEELFVLTDAMDPVAIVGANGSVQERYSYSAFGETSILDPVFADKATGTEFGWGFLFHNEVRDNETGLSNCVSIIRKPGVSVSEFSLRTSDGKAFWDAEISVSGLDDIDPGKYWVETKNLAATLTDSVKRNKDKLVTQVKNNLERFKNQDPDPAKNPFNLNKFDDVPGMVYHFVDSGGSFNTYKEAVTKAVESGVRQQLILASKESASAATPEQIENAVKDYMKKVKFVDGVDFVIAP